MFKKSRLKRFDFVLLFTTVILCIFGFVMINSATMSKPSGSEPYLKTQIVSFAIGLVILFTLTAVDYDIYGNFYIPVYAATILLLIYTLINPVNAEQWGGVRSWIAIGPIVFQPSELAKFGVIISVSKYIDINKDNLNSTAVLMKILIFAFIPVALILMQPDLGTALVFIFFIGVMLFVAGIEKKYIIAEFLIALIFLIICLVALHYIMEDYVPKENYMVDRIVAFFYPELDPENTGYQVIQSKTAIGSGMLYGRGLYKGVQNQLGYLPTKETDFIFAVIGEELGLAGGLSLLCLYGVLIYRLIKIAKSSANLFGSLIVSGTTAMLFFHIFENISMTMGLMPVTGNTLPFISYGGTFMLMNMISIGLSLEIGMKRDKIDIFDL